MGPGGLGKNFASCSRETGSCWKIISKGVTGFDFVLKAAVWSVEHRDTSTRAGTPFRRLLHESKSDKMVLYPRVGAGDKRWPRDRGLSEVEGGADQIS